MVWLPPARGVGRYERVVEARFLRTLGGQAKIPRREPRDLHRQHAEGFYRRGRNLAALVPGEPVRLNRNGPGARRGIENDLKADGFVGPGEQANGAAGFALKVRVHERRHPVGQGYHVRRHPRIDALPGTLRPASATGVFWLGRVEVADQRVGGHGQQVTFLHPVQTATKCVGTAQFVVAGNPSVGQLFAVLGEQWGFIGAVSVLILLAALLWRGVRTSLEAESPFAGLLAIGLTGSIGVYAVLNVAVVTGLAPTTGLPFPFLSYGGSALVANLFCVGVLLNISRSNTVGSVERHYTLRRPRRARA